MTTKRLPEEKKALIEKMSKALEGKNIGDILDSEEWRQNISAYLSSQRNDYKKAKEQAEQLMKRGFKVKSIRHTLENLDFLTSENFGQYYADCLAKSSSLNAASRNYILQLGGQAYNKTVIDLTIKAFPETRDAFYPPKQNN